jgi:predicted permease
MANLVVLFYCFMMGIIMKRTGRFPSSTARVLNQVVINISFPALALYYVHKLEFSAELIFPMMTSIIVFFVGAGFFLLMGKLLKLDRKTVGCLILAGALGNTAFVGFPLVQAFYGERLMGIAVLCDQGTFLMLSTMGIFVVAKYSAGTVTIWEVIKKVLMFPPFQAIILALLLKPVAFPVWLDDALKILGYTVTPLAIACVGFQLRLGDIKSAYRRLSLGLLYKLVLSPIVIMVLYVFVFGARGETIQISIFEAAMAPMITSSMLAAEHDLDRPLATLMVGVGIPLSFITVAIWHNLIAWV